MAQEKPAQDKTNKKDPTYFNEKTAPDATHQDRCTHRDRSTMRQREPQTVTPLER